MITFWNSFRSSLLRSWYNLCVTHAEELATLLTTEQVVKLCRLLNECAHIRPNVKKLKISNLRENLWLRLEEKLFMETHTLNGLVKKQGGYQVLRSYQKIN